MKNRRWWLAVSSAVLLPRLITLFIPLLAVDEAIYAIFGREILNGALPYQNLVDYKAPVIFYLYALCFWIADHLHLPDMSLVHLAHLGFVAATCEVLFRLGRHLRDEKAGWLAALFFAIFSACYNSKHALATNAEPLMVLPLALAVWCLFQSDNKFSWHRDIMCGVWLSTAFLIKYTSGINLALTVGYLIVVRPIALQRATLAQGVGRAALCMVGFALPIIGFVLYFWSLGALSDFYFWGWKYNQRYIAQGGSYLTWDYFLLKFMMRTAHVALAGLAAWVLACIATVRILKPWRRSLTGKSREDVELLFVAGWFLVTFIPVSVGGRFFYHYFMQFTAPVCLLAALAAREYWSSKQARMVIVTVSLISLAVFMTESTLRLHEKDARDDAIVSHLQNHSSADERLFIWGYLPKIHYFSQRRPASRFVFSQFMTGSQPMTHGMDFDPAKPEARPSAWRRVMMDYSSKMPPLQIYDTSKSAVPESWTMLFEDFRAHPPRYILDTAPANVDRYGKYPIKNYPELKNYLDTNYSLEISIGGVDLYRRH